MLCTVIMRVINCMVFNILEILQEDLCVVRTVLVSLYQCQRVRILTSDGNI